MPSLGRELSVPRTWFLSVRLVELAVVALLVGAGLEMWQAFQASSQGLGPYSGDPTLGADPVSLMQRLMAFAFFGGIFQGPVLLLLAACLLVAAVGVLHLAKPVSNAGLLRWELLVGWSAVALLVLVRVLTTAVAMFGHDPNRSQDPNVVYGYQGPSLVAQGVAILVWPVAAGAVLTVAALWWLRLPQEFDEPEEDAAQREARQAAAERRARLHQPAPSADLDDIVLDGVEQIDPVERLEPRHRVLGDGGSTSSGYDDYFRRF